MAGLGAVVSHRGRPAARVGISPGESLASLDAMSGTRLAPRQRDAIGRGQLVDPSLLESAPSGMERLVPGRATAPRRRAQPRRARRSAFSTFPIGLRGSASTKRHTRGTS